MNQQQLNPYFPRYRIKDTVSDFFEASEKWAGSRIGLVRNEVTHWLTRLSWTAIALGTAAFLALFTWIWLSYSLIVALSRVMPLGWAAFSVAVLHGVLAVVALTWARSQWGSASSSTSLNDRNGVLEAQGSVDPFLHYAKEADEAECRSELVNAEAQMRTSKAQFKRALVEESNPKYWVAKYPKTFVTGGFLTGWVLHGLVSKALRRL